MRRQRGLCEKLNSASTFDELLQLAEKCKSFRGMSLKHMKFLAERKKFMRDLLADGFTLLDIKFAILHHQHPVHKICPMCNANEIHSSGFSYSKTCGSEACVRAMRLASMRKTNLARYGVECTLSDPETYKKGKETRIEKYGSNCNYAQLSANLMSKYGVSCTWDIPGVREKSKKTMNQRYGCDYALQSPAIQEKSAATCIEKFGAKCPLQNEKIREKSIASCQRKHGVNFPMQSSEVKAKQKQSFLSHYGIDHNMKSEQGLNAYSASIHAKYGKDFVVQTEMFREKAKSTCLERYGVEHPMKSKEVRDKQRMKFAYGMETFDSSWELAFWIFCKDHCIKLEHESVRFTYEDSDGKQHTYFPDFRICGNVLIEIKGDDQFDENGNMIDKLDCLRNHIAEAKHQCMIRNNVVIMKSREMKPFLDYISQKYGKHYLNQFKRNHKSGTIQTI